ncbi:phytanoyl-CoA dioxygenase family protein [Kiloniella sp. EL199]|uniref:phytanoyl-CoA dioxygenase family protein n=1 Tax=Kiloniella sp. EL199 TaxID=2107581 RepID=UPI0020B1347F|nr:phytanoyl-CoA dioxygenase family protein [Kiloniella sp. EL199]
MSLTSIVDLKKHPISDTDFMQSCQTKLDQNGALVLEGFLLPEVVALIKAEGEKYEGQAYFCAQKHTVYLSPQDPEFSNSHPRNRLVASSKGCITDDQIPQNSPLQTLYHDTDFKKFLCTVLKEEALHQYADPLSSINLHYTRTGQELGWHFDNSSFATTLMIQEPEAGGAFEYVSDFRDADRGEMNFEDVGKVLDGETPVNRLSMSAGALILFRGRNAIHRVAPVEGGRTRMLVVLAYNSKPGIALSEAARMTFYGRLD